jgi:hypothetical protein
MEMNVYFAISAYNTAVLAFTELTPVTGHAQTAGKEAVSTIFSTTTVPTLTTLIATEPYKGLITVDVVSSVAKSASTIAWSTAATSAATATV